MTAPRDTESTPTNGPKKAAGPRHGNAAPPANAPRPAETAPRAGRPAAAEDPGAAWSQGGAAASRDDRTTVLPGGNAARRPAPARTAPARPPVRTEGRTTGGGARPGVGRARRTRLTLRRIDPWSVFLFSLVASVFVGIALVVAVALLYAVLGALGVTESLNELFAEVTGGSPTTGALLTSGRIIGGATVLAAVNVVFLTLLATLSAMLYNLCASFTGGVELTLGERD